MKDDDLGFTLKEVEYIVAHKGLFQRAPIHENDDHQVETAMWRATLDRALLDYIKGPQEVGKKIFAEVSLWLKDEEDTGDFEEVCNLATVPSDSAMKLFHRFRYTNKEV